MRICDFCKGAGVSWYPVDGGAQAACHVCAGASIVPGVEYTTAPILESDADALVAPVNTVGVMGAGLAKAFARRYPDLARDYAIKCAQRALQVGTLFFWRIPFHDDDPAPRNRCIVCLPTKRDWRQPSQVEFVETGLRLFAELYDAFREGDIGALPVKQAAHHGRPLVQSASFPQLGCGLGGLAWDQVKPLMEQYLSNLPIRVRVHLTPESGGKPWRRST